MKRLLFYLLTLLLIFTIVSGVWVSWDLSNQASLFRIFGAACTLIIIAIPGFSQINSLSHEFRHTFLGDYLLFLKGLLPIKTIEVATDAAVDDNLEWLKSSTLKYCQDETQKIKFLNLTNIDKRNIELFDFSNIRVIESRKLKDKNPVEELQNQIAKKKFRRVFIIGGPGTGKSHLVKEYVIKLLEDTSDIGQIPLFLPAASWEEGFNFVGWILSTAEKLYDIPKSVVEGILTSYKHRVVLVIDGLDEIKMAYRENFVTELNRYSSENKIVVSCRDENFRSLTLHTKVRVNVALKLEPLSDDQITGVVKENLPERYQLFKEKKLSKILNTPLLLGLYTKVFGAKTNLANLDFEKMSEGEIRSILWQEYIDQAYSLKKDGIVNSETPTEDEVEEGMTAFTPAPPVFNFKFDKTRLQQYSSNLAGKISTSQFSISNIQPISIFDWYGRLVYILLNQVIIGVLTSIGLGLVMGGPLEFLTGGLLGGLLSTIFYVLTHQKEVFTQSVEPNIIPLSGIKGFLKKGIHLAAYLMFLLIGFTFYFCLSGKRKDMSPLFGQPDIIATDDFRIALIFAVIFSLILGFHQVRHNLTNDIRLIDSQKIIAKNLRHALLHGLLFSLLLAPAVGLIGKLYIFIFPQQFFSKWLVSSVADWDYGLFQFVVIVIFPIAFLLGFVVGLNNRSPIVLKPNTETDSEADSEARKEAEKWKNQQKSQLKPYYSIMRTVKATILFWLISSMIGSILWGGISNVFAQEGWDAINKGVESALGGGIFVGLYWGGKDLIKMWILRLIMYLRRELPLQHSRLLYELEIVGILKRQGALFEYAHSTLKEFLSQEKPSKSNYMSIFRVLLLTTGTILLVSFSVNNKIKGRHDRFWKNQVNIQLDYPNNDFEKIDDSSLKCFRSGAVSVESNGKISAGRILGHITPAGTEIGFFALAIGDSFDIKSFESFRHGELIYRKSKLEPWESVFQKAKVPPFYNFRFKLSFMDTIQVQKNDTLEFVINDGEPENNSGKLIIKLDFIE